MNESTFSPEIWKLVTEAPQLAGMAPTALDFGVVSSVREATAVQGALEALTANTDSVLLSRVWARFSDKNQTVELEPVSDQAALVPQILARIESAVKHVNAAGVPDEAARYKSVIFKVAEAAVNASGDGLFGMGAKVSPAEQEYLNKLRTILA